MSELKIDIKVTGEEKVEALENRLKSLNTHIANADKGIVALGVALGTIGTAFSVLTNKAQEWQDKLDDVNGSTQELLYGSQALDDGLNQMSYSLVKAVEQTDLYRNAVDLLQETYDGWTSILTGKTIEAIERERDATNKAITAKEDHTKAVKEDAKALREANKAIEANIRHQKLLTSFEEKAEASKKAKVDAYEAELKAIDAAIDAINAETQAQVDNIEVKQQAVQTSDDLTESLNNQADASNTASGGGDGYSVTVSAESQASKDYEYATSMKMRGYDMSQEFARLAELQKRMYEEQRKTNDLIGG